MLAALFAALTLAAPDHSAQLVPVSLPSKGDAPIIHEGQLRPGEATPAPGKRVFVIGVAFQNRGGAQGIALEQVVPGSPADRAGLTVGTIVVEIEGQSTLGRSAEDCTRMVREAGNTVSLKYYDPLTFKLRTRTLQKDWILPPN